MSYSRIMTAGQTIHILRHAHSSWAIPGQRDHQRVLDDRGREDARRLASRLDLHASSIRQVVCSSAIRARQTLDLVRSALPADVAVRFSDDLYALGPEAYAAEIRGFEGNGELLLIGHNPTIEELVFGMCLEETEALRMARPGVGTAHWLTIARQADDPDGDLRGALRTVLKP